MGEAVHTPALPAHAAAGQSPGLPGAGAAGAHATTGGCWQASPGGLQGHQNLVMIGELSPNGP